MMRDRQTQTDTDRQTDRQTDREQDQPNTTYSVLKLKHPFRNADPGQKNLSYQQICQQNCNVLEVMSVSV